MLLDDGRTLTGNQLLKPSSVALMTSNQTDNLMAAYGGLPGSEAGFGFGLGVLVLQKDGAGGLPFRKGAFGWDGQAQRRFWVDPSEQLVLVMMITDALERDHERANAPLVQRDIEKAAVSAIR